MKNIAFIVYRELRFIYVLGASNYVKYKLTSKGKPVKLVINGRTVSVRKGTPDLSAAVSCLIGEFEILRYLFPENYERIIVDAGGYIGTATSARALKNMQSGY